MTSEELTLKVSIEDEILTIVKDTLVEQIKKAKELDKLGIIAGKYYLECLENFATSFLEKL